MYINVDNILMLWLLHGFRHNVAFTEGFRHNVVNLIRFQAQCCNHDTISGTISFVSFSIIRGKGKSVKLFPQISRKAFPWNCCRWQHCKGCNIEDKTSSIETLNYFSEMSLHVSIVTFNIEVHLTCFSMVVHRAPLYIYIYIYICRL